MVSAPINRLRIPHDRSITLLSAPSCLPSPSIVLPSPCHSHSGLPGNKFQLGPIQTGSLGLAWATLVKGNLGKACRVIRAAWARQGSHDCPSPRSSSFSGILGMTWALLPRECPRQCHPAIECPICGILSSNYAQHYNRRHGQREWLYQAAPASRVGYGAWLSVLCVW